MSSDKPPPADTLQLPGRSIAARIDRLDIIYDIFRDACEEFRWELHCFPFTYFHTPTRRVNFRTIFCACRTKIEANSLLPGTNLLRVGIKLAMLEELPRDILGHVAAFMSDDLQACDPRCYRAARCVQAAWRGWVTRFRRWRCNFCGERVFLGVKFSKCWYEVCCAFGPAYYSPPPRTFAQIVRDAGEQGVVRHPRCLWHQRRL